jgi:hypothetical protein
MLSEITVLEFFQHYFSEMGHRDLLVTQNLSQAHRATNAPLTGKQEEIPREELPTNHPELLVCENPTCLTHS